MQFLSYPIGLLIGLFPIAVELGPSRAPAHILLDGRPVCEVTERSPGCTVDLGPDPRVHLLELLRTDAAGRVTERVVRWVNRPGVEPEVLVSGGCDEKTLVCDFGLTWAHPAKLDPKLLVLQLDGTKRWESVDHKATFTVAKGYKPQIVSCDVEFPDGTRATYTRTLFSFNPEEAQASLVALPVIPGPDAGSNDALAARLKEAGLPVRTVEESEPEVTFVMDAHALDKVRWPALRSKAFDKVHVVFPDESLPADTLRLERLGWTAPSTRRASTLSRYADAVAAAGYALGASPKRRAVVLVLSGFDRPNGSSFTAAQARAYLAEVMVPLVVWRIGNVDAPEWPAGPVLGSHGEVLDALDALGAEIARQRMLWLEGFRDTRYSGHWLVPGVALAGRDPATKAAAPDAPPRAIEVGTMPSLGPDGGPVHAIAAAPGELVVYAGTHGGVFRSRDRGEHWEAASAGLPITPVRCLAAGGGPGVVYAGTGAGLFSSADGGGDWTGAPGELGAMPVTAIALDPASPRILFVGTTGGGVLRSDDAGETLLATALGHGDVRALVVEPKSRTLVAATEDGVFRSGDRGLTWTEGGRLPARALALALDPGGALFAATAGQGLWSSGDGGASWRRTSLTAAYLTSLGFGAPDSRLSFAGSPDGIFVSQNGGVSWKLARVGAIEALAGGAAAPLAGSERGVLRRAGPSGVWRVVNAGLTASVAWSVTGARGSEDTLYAASSEGLRRLGGAGSTWTAVPGIPDGVVAEAVVALAPAAGDLCVGTTGGIGRSEDSGTVWSFAPTHAAFQLALDPSRPDVLLAAAREGVLKSEDGGRHWAVAANGMEKTFALQLGHDPADPLTFYAATAGSGVYRTVDAARTWKAGGPQLIRRIVRSVAVDRGSREIVYAGTDSGVFRSGDGGSDWLPASEGLPRAPVYALLADPRSAGVVFAGTAQGLFRSGDGGTRWELFPADGLSAAVISLWIDADASTLVAGTLGRGVFRLPLPSAEAPR